MVALNETRLRSLLKRELYWILSRVLAIALLQAFVWLLAYGNWLSFLGTLQSTVQDFLQKLVYSFIVLFLLQTFNRFFVPSVKRLFLPIVKGFAKEPLARRRMLGQLERYITYFGYVLALLGLMIIWYSRVGPWLASFLTNIFVLITSFMIGLFTSSVLGNVLAYWTLSHVDLFKKGDRIKVGNAFGDIIDFGFFFTKVKTTKNEIVNVPNLQVIENGLSNYSTLGTVLVHVPITLSYDLDKEEVKRILVKSAMKTDGILKEGDKKPFVLFLDISYSKELGKNAITYEINAYTDRPNEITRIKSELIENILEGFKEAGIKI
ncbi:MAG TPA: mechanosensitive ion channel [Candidatus Korarchaeota archaeon]|nr:mechanosensitive ion channel [Candidatus Korarchaeota archaeon]